MNKAGRFFLGFFGFLILIIGISALFHGVVGLMNAEPITIITIGNISEFVDVQEISERDFTLLMTFNVVIGVLLILIGNSFLFQSTSKELFHPRCGDLMKMMGKNR